MQVQPSRPDYYYNAQANQIELKQMNSDYDFYLLNNQGQPQQVNLMQIQNVSQYDPLPEDDPFLSEDEEWFEKHYQKIQRNQEQTTSSEWINHEVQMDDTLEGLEIQYGVPTHKIKQLNKLSTNDIFYMKSIKVPNPQYNYQRSEQLYGKINEEYLKSLKIQQFVEKVLKDDEKSDKMARAYLDMNEWNFKLAAREYLSDYRFEQQRKQNPYNMKKYQ